MSYSCQICPAALGRSLGVFVKLATAVLVVAVAAFTGVLGFEAPKEFCGWAAAGLATALLVEVGWAGNAATATPVGGFKSDSMLAGATNDETVGLGGLCHGAVAAAVDGVAGGPNKFCNLVL